MNEALAIFDYSNNLYQALRDEYLTSDDNSFEVFVRRACGLECEHESSSKNIYRIIDQKLWMKAKIKWGL